MIQGTTDAKKKLKRIPFRRSSVLIGCGIVTNLIRGAINRKVHYKLHLPILQLIDKLVSARVSYFGEYPRNQKCRIPYSP